MSIGTILHAALAANSGVAALVSTRIYPLLLPQEPTLSALTYQRISNTAQQGSTDLRESRYQINCWASSYAGAVTLSAAVKTLLEEYGNTLASVGIKMAYIANEQDDYEDDTRVFRVLLDVIFVTIGD